MPRFAIPVAGAPLCIAALLAACGGENAGTTDTTAASAAAPQQPTRIATATGFETPESALWDSAGGVWLVSNINGQPGAKDNNGFISRVRPDGSIDSLRWIAGSPSLPLSAPKGMAIRDNELWVSDIDAVHVFDRTSGAHIAHYDLTSANAIFLNDVAVGPDGAVYITDTAIRFTESGIDHPGTDKIFRIEPQSKAVSVAVEGDTLQRPNGIVWDAAGNRFVVVPFGGPEIKAWTPGASAPTVIASGAGQFDGAVITSDGRTLVSSWADSSVSAVSGDSLTRVITGVPSPADIGIDRATNRVAIPIFTGGRVEIWEIGTP